MNLFAGMGKIAEVKSWGKVLSFTVVTQQENPTFVPCRIFNPEENLVGYLSDLQNSGRLVWIQGRVSSYEFKGNYRPKRDVNIITYPKSIRLISG